MDNSTRMKRKPATMRVTATVTNLFMASDFTHTHPAVLYIFFKFSS